MKFPFDECGLADRYELSRAASTFLPSISWKKVAKACDSCEGFLAQTTIFLHGARKQDQYQARMNDEARVCRELARRTAVLAGDEAAWRAWYDEAYEPLRFAVFWKVGREGVDEVVQETWLIAVKRIRTFDPRQGAFFDWLRGIAVNVIRNRSRDRTTASLPLETVSETPGTELESQHDVAERAVRVAAVLSALPEQYAAVLKAKYLEQQSVNDIAEEWNQTVKAIESLLTRARSAFRSAFGMEN